MFFTYHSGPLHIRDWEPVTVTLQALSHWWKRPSRSKFASSHCARGTNGACESKMDVNSTWTPTWHQTEHVSRPLGLVSKTTSWTQTQHKTGVRPWHSERSQPSVYSTRSYMRTHVNRKIHPNNISRRARSHTASHDTRGSVTTPTRRRRRVACGLSQTAQSRFSARVGKWPSNNMRVST